jgi:predicted ferric reductase
MHVDLTRRSYRGVQVVRYSLYIIEALLVIRFLLKLLSANPDAAFTNLVYTVSGVFTWPFVAVFSNSVLQSSIFEWTTLLAMAMYWVLAIAIIKLFVMGKPVSTLEADERLSQEEV